MPLPWCLVTFFFLCCDPLAIPGAPSTRVPRSDVDVEALMKSTLDATREFDAFLVSLVHEAPPEAISLRQVRRRPVCGTALGRRGVGGFGGAPCGYLWVLPPLRGTPAAQ